MEENYNFAEYGRQVNLYEPWHGYSRGTIVAKNGYRFVIEFSSGAQVECYDDKFCFD